MTLDTIAAARADPAPRSPPRRGVRLSTLRAVIRNPLEAMPADVFREPLVHMRVQGVNRIYLIDPDLIQEALVRHADDLIKSEDVRRTLGPALGQGLLTAEGAHWRVQRRSVAPVFQHQRLLKLVPPMIAAAERTRERWLRQPLGVPLRVGHEMMHTTFDIIAETMLSGAGGVDVARVERSVTDYLAPTGWVLAYSLIRAPKWTPYPGRGRSLRAAGYLRRTLAEMVARRRTMPHDREDLVDLLLTAVDPEGGQAMSDGEIVDNLVTFISAGHETTANGLAWTFHLLAAHPEVEARLRAEIDAVTGGGDVRPEHVAELTYCRQVFSEAMRLYPPAPIISREVARPFRLDGREITAGSILNIPIYALHRHQRLWTDPERFDPERFAPEVAARRPRYAYMPFGAGPRICIGSAFAMMEAVAVLAVLLQRLTLRDVAARPSVATMRITLRPVPDLEMTVAGRAA